MKTLFHSFTYLTLGLWLGAVAFFGSVVAPLAFEMLPSLFPAPTAGLHAARLIVANSLVRLHWIGLLCGAIFLSTLVLGRTHYRSILPQGMLVLLMMLLTAYSQFSVIPRMNTARDAIGGNFNAVPADNPGREIFDRLHETTTHAEAVIFVCGLCALAATAHWSRRETETL